MENFKIANFPHQDELASMHREGFQIGGCSWKMQKNHKFLDNVNLAPMCGEGHQNWFALEKIKNVRIPPPSRNSAQVKEKALKCKGHENHTNAEFLHKGDLAPTHREGRQSGQGVENGQNTKFLDQGKTTPKS